MSIGDLLKEAIQNPEMVAIAVTSVIGGAALIVKGIEMITKITPSKKDDAYASKLVRGVAWVQSVVDKFVPKPKQ